MAKNIILSFDYELFFGDEPGTVQKSLLEPTNKLLDALHDVGGKATFFVDYLMLKRMLSENQYTKEEAGLIIDQLKNIVRCGNRIELHIHPHWVDAKYINSKWDFSDFSHYCLNSFSQDEITHMFVEGTNMLECIARDVIPDYKVIAFRAGGWAILPFNIMREGFVRAGILLDSSVMKGSVIHANGYDLDFSTSPPEPIYHFSSDVLNKDSKGTFIEAQIGSFRHSIISTLLNIFYHKNHKDEFIRLTDGTHTRKNDGDSVTQSKSMNWWHICHQIQAFSLAGLPSFLLNYQLIKTKYSYVIIISHPKDIMPITCKNIKGLGGKFVFCTYKDLI